MNDCWFISDTTNESLHECGVMNFSFNGNKHDIVHHDGETMSVRSTLSQTNSHIYMLTDMPLDETPDIQSDYKNLLLVDQKEVFLVKDKRKNGVDFSV